MKMTIGLLVLLPAAMGIAGNKLISSFHSAHEGNARFTCTVSSCTTGCTTNNTAGHTAPGSGTLVLDGTAHMGCFAGAFCDGNHNSCGSGGKTLLPSENTRETVLVGLLSEVASGSVGALETLASQYHDQIRYNSDRRTLQVLGCTDETVIANVPLSLKQISVFGD